MHNSLALSLFPKLFGIIPACLVQYLQNAYSALSTQSSINLVIQGNSVGVLFNYLLAGLSAILDGFFANTTSDLHRGGCSGMVWSHKVAR